MTTTDIRTMRLSRTGLIGTGFASAPDVVSHLGAVQAQDFPGAAYSIGLRIRNARITDIERAYNEGKIVRTHVMRPTWHFVLPENVRWMQTLTAPNVKRIMATYTRKFGLTDEILRQSNRIIAKALEKEPCLTRKALRTLLTQNLHITPDALAVGFLLIWAELDALIVSGPKIGKQLTYALLDRRAPYQKALSREESLGTLALTYFSSHGPAQRTDFSWWSGLSKKDAETGLSLCASKLREVTAEGKTYWVRPESDSVRINPPVVHLLSIYDEYIIAYKDRSALNHKDVYEKLFAMGNLLTSVIVIDGRIIGSSKRTMYNNHAVLRLTPFRALSRKEEKAVAAVCTRYGRFFGIPVSHNLPLASS